MTWPWAGERLRILLKNIIDSLRESDPVAVELLASIVACDGPGGFGAIPEGLYIFVCDCYGKDIGSVKYAEAMRALHTFSLVRLTRTYLYINWPDRRRCHINSITADDEPILVCVHSFVSSILRDLLREDVVRLNSIVHECLERRLEQILPTVDRCHKLTTAPPDLKSDILRLQIFALWNSETCRTWMTPRQGINCSTS